LSDQAPETPADVRPGRRRLHTEAVERRGRWPGVVWAIPLAALLVVAYLGIEAIANRGVDVVVTFHTSGGARAGDTPVIYKGVTVGHVVRIRIAENARDVDMTLRLESRARSRLRDGTKFWLIGAEPSLTDLNSLKATLSGVSIGVSPGDGAPRRHFVGFDQPPVVPPDQAGTLYVVDGAYVGSTRVGSGVYYHGLNVGRITRESFMDPQTARLVIFVNAPYDRMVRPDTLFYNAAAANVSLAGGHFSALLGPGSSVITGGIEFDTPETAAGEAQSPANTLFHYYPDKAQAQEQPRGPQVRYRALFHAASQRPQEGAPVMLSGARIGRVISSEIRLPDDATEPQTTVDLEIEPQSLGLPTGGDVRASTDGALRRLLKGGYRLQLGQSPPFIGSADLVLQRGGTTRVAALAGSGDATLIPTAGAAGMEELTGKVNTILDKVNAVPIEAIGSDVRQITARLNRLVSSPALSDSLQHLDGTLNQVDAMLAEVKPQVGPLIGKLNQAADQLNGAVSAANATLSGQGAAQDTSLPEAIRQLNDAARSIRTLADYLGRHPEAVLRGRPKDEK
jgi:paraquat-inducible protein B